MPSIRSATVKLFRLGPIAEPKIVSVSPSKVLLSCQILSNFVANSAKAVKFARRNVIALGPAATPKCTTDTRQIHDISVQIHTSLRRE